MDSIRFDALTRSLGSSIDRRAALRGSIAAIAGAALGLNAFADGMAKNKKRKRCKPRCDACETCQQRQCVPKQDFASCGKHKHCVGNVCVACAPNRDACDLGDPAACCSLSCCAAGVGPCPPDGGACCC